jgi:uncharacterized protein YoxC
MSASTSQSRWIRNFLFLIGILGIFVGLGISAYAAFLVRPRLAAINDQIHHSLAAVDRLTLKVGASNVLGPSRDTLNVLPATLIALKGTLIEASNSLSATGTTAQKTQEGAAGLVLPKKSIQASNIHLQGTAEQLRQLSKVVDDLSRSTASLVRSVDSLSPSVTQMVQGTRTQIQNIQQSLQTAAIPTQAMLLGFGLGGLYIFLGISLVLIASMYHQAIVASETSSGLTTAAIPSQRAA